MAGKSKYNNCKVILDGYVFDSKAEARRWQELKLLEQKNVIQKLQRQVPYVIVPKGPDERAVKYIADFQYRSEGRTIVEDVKGMKTQSYILKRKMFKYRFPKIIFREVKV